MIKSNELRVGSTYNLPSGYNRLPSGEVTLSEQEMAFIFEVCCFEEINPIPLTKERLIDNGMNNLGYFPEVGYLEETNDGWYLIGIERDFINNNPMKYLHQFQNFYFALEGKELEIKQSKP